jgi:hypothetical protein
MQAYMASCQQLPYCLTAGLQVAYRMYVSQDFEQQFLELEQQLSGCIVDLSAALNIKA